MSQQHEVRILDGSLIRHLDAFRLALLHRSSKTVFPEIVEAFGPEQAVKFLDLFHGLTIKIPDRSFLDLCVRDADIYAVMKKQQPLNRLAKTADALSEKYGVSPDEIVALYKHMVYLHKMYGYDR